MKVITWNCNGALRKKTAAADSFGADILVIQECEDPAQSTKEYREWAGSYLWKGKNKNKGIGVFSRNGYQLSELGWNGEFQIKGLVSQSPSLRWTTADLESFLPCKINNELTLLAVWTKSASSPNFGYMGQFWKFLQIHREDLRKDKTIICGDFNSNVKWDEPDRWWSHSDVVSELAGIGVQSLYHHQHKEAQGSESSPTFFLHRKEQKPYHIDYVFLSDDLVKDSSIIVGDINHWLEFSDHMPLEVTLKGHY
ncbi:endonuclease/exonuclease/phosphatase family protein [Pontibacterium sp. N1Y112]|uniref:Endonuclease/exonuclease/phosphatase family protein n=1 Tax=Pontibacterium sinense TaxID=2781979 RepID=A0A8J7F8J8_9GAMM|nr:endonuclease/exonuclease/phosphatase family protein [Pontibacterium sinense]MBE9397105.1 endonuclease/exonuclease/phosphatase family protein [Pontibacterium sinense]